MTLAGTSKPTRHRYWIAVMLFITVVINYLDRSNISTTVVAMKEEFGMDNPAFLSFSFDLTGAVGGSGVAPARDRSPP